MVTDQPFYRRMNTNVNVTFNKILQFYISKTLSLTWHNQNLYLHKFHTKTNRFQSAEYVRNHTAQ